MLTLVFEWTLQGTEKLVFAVKLNITSSLLRLFYFIITSRFYREIITERTNQMEYRRWLGL